MARIRSVKPELRRDLTVAEWTRECRYAWVLLWGYLDDEGRGIDDLRLLTADLFPLDRDVTERKLDGWLNKMAAPTEHGEPPLCRYTVGTRRFMHAPKWDRSQRVSHPQESKCPPCPLHESDAKDSGIVPEPIQNETGAPPVPFRPSRTPEVLGVKGAREQGSKGSGDGAPRPAATAELVTLDGTDTAGTLIAEWLEHVKRPPGSVIGQVGKHLATMLAEGIDPADLRRGLAAWASKGLHPSALPSVVNEAMNAQTARPAVRLSTSDQRYADGQALVAKYKALEEQAQ